MRGGLMLAGLMSLAGAAVALAPGCGDADAFACVSNEQCGVGGQCEDSGDCSFDDPDCPSGRRWGHLAGDGNADQCVDTVAAGTADDGIDDGNDDGNDAGNDDGNDDGGPTETTDGAADESGGAPACSAGVSEPGRCSPVPPPKWMGPLLAFQADAATLGQLACPDDAPQDLGTYFDGLTAGPAECACACESELDCTAQLHNFPVDDPGCDGMSSALELAPRQCADFDDGMTSGAWGIDVPLQEGGACVANPTVSLPDVQWSIGVRLCGQEPIACDDGVCVAAPPSGVDAAVCIVRPGVHACPLSGYTQAREFYGDVADGRGCETCACDSAEGGLACLVELYRGKECRGNDSSYLADSGELVCLGDEGNGMGGWGSLRVTNDCARPSAPVGPIGEASPSAPMTVCCLP